MSKKTEIRRNAIYEQILEEGSVKAAQLAAQYNVSLETIRIDLNHLDQQGIVRKTHGGATMVEEYSEVSIDLKVNEHAQDKQKIGLKALQYIQDDTTIFLDPGSTTLALAKYLPLKKNLTIVTNSLMIAQVVSESKHDLILLGGKVTKKAKAATGPFANEQIRMLHIDQAFMGCDGFMNAYGPTTFAFFEMEVKQRVMENSKENILLCDKSKCHKTGKYIFADFSQFDKVITNYLNNYERRMVTNAKEVIMTGV